MTLNDFGAKLSQTEPASPRPMIYDISLDEHRPLEQSELDEMEQFQKHLVKLFWGLEKNASAGELLELRQTVRSIIDAKREALSLAPVQWTELGVEPEPDPVSQPPGFASFEALANDWYNRSLDCPLLTKGALRQCINELRKTIEAQAEFLPQAKAPC
jgi:hypothetical protein